MKFDIIN